MTRSITPGWHGNICALRMSGDVSLLLWIRGYSTFRYPGALDYRTAIMDSLDQNSGLQTDDGFFECLEHDREAV
jgi:hypothetical protein